jgi:cytochrome P450 PksS
VDIEGRGLLGLLSTVPRIARLFRYLRGLIRRRRGDAGEDLLSAMIAAEEGGERLSPDELVASTFLLLFAGHETTVNLIGNGMLALLEHPDQLERLRADPSLIDGAVEELLRYTNPVQVVAARYARMDLELSGFLVPKGAYMVPSLGSANRDERQFPDPERLDLGRTPNKHLAFGFGAHYCVGAPLARLEAKAAFLALVDRFPKARLAVPREELRWRDSFTLHGLQALPLLVS